MKPIAFVFAIAAGVLVLGPLGCGSSPAASGPAVSGLAPDGEATPADSFSDPSCGRYENQNQPVSGEQKKMNRCILNAAAEGQPAELVATYATVEGAAIPQYFRVLGPDEVEVLVDATADPWGSGGWSRQLCKGLVAEGGFLGGVDCREVPLDEG